ncbi:membrane protein insertion efficiency factor YidD [Streptomyces sp. NBC_01511]|uniref:membrane protein insertion efficiency factor YidD n=1 Tax=unclassified Streptomyces TaxID=2593676 RepID=UPI003863BE8A
MATSRRADRARERQARHRRQGRYESGDDGPRDDDNDDTGCLEKAADSCVMCRQCCPQMWLSALPAVFFAFLRPSAGRDPAAPRPAGRTAGALYGAVRHYRAEISPDRPPCCPYTPSCSTYAVKALHRHGALRGGRLVVGRLLRCRPGAARRRGFRDPVPDRVNSPSSTEGTQR